MAARFSLVVITPTLGTSRWLEETVASVRALSLSDGHRLVAPEGQVAQLARRFPDLRIVAEPGGGMYAAINAGLAAAGEWDAFTYLNDDDCLLPGFARVAALLAARSREACFAYGGVRLIDGAGHRLGTIPVSPWPRINRQLYAQRLEPVYQHGTLVSRAAWERCGGFDPAFRYCGDSEFLARLCVGGVTAKRVWGEVAAFRLHRGQLTKNREVMQAERRRVDEKHGLTVPRLHARHFWARLVFRAANLPAYGERLVRHGYKTFDQVLTEVG